jgi:hypothetical protein
MAECPDCHVALVLELPEAGRESELELDALVPVRRAPVAWIQGLAEALAAAGISSRVERVEAPDGSGSAAAVFVRPEDREAALALDASFARTAIPDLPDESPPGWSEAERCPACQTPLVADAEECLECGLAFVEAD